jgi:6-phosphogluconolactonase (cycloisomerase 2 family)
MLDYGLVRTHGIGDTQGLNGARDVVVTGDGKDVYVAGYDSDAVAHFRQQPGSGAYDFGDMVADSQPGVIHLDGPQALALSPDEGYVYVAAAAGDALVVLERDATSGELSFDMAAIDNVGTHDYLDGAYDLVVSSNGRHIYVASIEEDSVAHYEHDRVAGTLSLRSVVADGTGVFGLIKANGLAISPDGRHVLAAGRQSGAVAVLPVDPTHGTLSFHAMWDYNDISELSGARAVTISPDGRRVYVAAQYADAVVAFARDAATGDLTFLEAFRDSFGGVEGIDTANGLALSADGRHLYVAGYGDAALAIFHTRASVYLPVVLR